MVTFPAVGRMGNFLFEAATALSYSLKHGLDFSVPNTTTDNYWSPIYLKHLINPNFNPRLATIHLWENGHGYQELPFDESYRDKNIVVEGYRQSEMYFKHHRKEILYIFGLPYEMNPGVVSVHVRRGDYLKLAMKHPPVPKEWFEKAMTMFPGMKFKFFSDDISWCAHTFGHRDDCSFSTNTNEVDDLIEMSCCEHNINSSSTFSWWAAWLNQNPDKKIITPELWFQPGWGGLETKDIVPDEWIKLPNYGH